MGVHKLQGKMRGKKGKQGEGACAAPRSEAKEENYSGENEGIVAPKRRVPASRRNKQRPCLTKPHDNSRIENEIRRLGQGRLERGRPRKQLAVTIGRGLLLRVPRFRV